MRRDSIFYRLFQLYPALLFELLPEPPDNAESYRFDSVAVKEPRFEIDGVILPPEGKPGTVFFVEVQFQKDERLYERVLAESALYFYRNRERFRDWRSVIIYPSRSMEQSDLYPHLRLLDSGLFYRVFLDELGDIQQLPIWVAAMVLTTVSKAEAPDVAKDLLRRLEEPEHTAERRGIINMITTIISYRFDQISWQEVEEMLDISFKETRVYREIAAEATAQGIAQGEASIITRLLGKRFGELSDEMRASIFDLPVADLEKLSEVLLDFDTVSEVESWIKRETGTAKK